tara:strand:- start:337 stop:555 length:219 start_codon:yes stop_codon:yes gene_type:complete
MNRVSIESFNAKNTIGLQIGYNDKMISKTEIIDTIQEYQNQLIKEKGVYLSIALSTCLIVLSGQVEPHLEYS